MASDEDGLIERIRTHAYHLWQESGQPHGRDEEFWERARELITVQGSQTDVKNDREQSTARPAAKPRKSALRTGKSTRGADKR